tara:strand:- start:1252 stop:1443 length:192 start_codon:yes stop_codon:yes gene_type:complete
MIERRREDELQRVERQKDRRLQLIQIAKDLAIENRKLLPVSEAVDLSVGDLVVQAKELEDFVE